MSHFYYGTKPIGRVAVSFAGKNDGTDTSDATLTSGGQMLQGITAYGANGKVTGTIETKNNTDLTVNKNVVTVPKGYYTTNVSATISEVSLSAPTIELNDANGLVTSNITQSSGYVAGATKSATLQLSTKGTNHYTPTKSSQAIDGGVYLIGDQIIDPIPDNYIDTTDANASADDIASGKTAYINGVKVTGIHECEVPTLQSKTVTPSEETQLIIADDGYDALSDVTVNAIQVETKNITTNGTYTPSNGKYFSSVNVNIVGDTFDTQTKTVNPTESEQTITPDVGYDGLSSVTVGAISSTYVGSAVPIQGTKTVTPSASVQTAVSSGTYVNGDITVDAIPSNYIDTSDATATDSDIASGVTAYVNGEKVVGTITTVEQNSVRNRFNFNAMSFQSANNSILLEGEASGDTLFRSGSYSQTYIPGFNFGIAKEENVLSGKTFTSLYGLKITGTMPSKEAATITPTTTDQIIDAGQYLSGVQTIQGDANLVAENIASGVSIFGVTGTHEGGSGIDTSDADATSADIIKDKTAYVNGVKLTGTLEVQNYYTGNTTPDSTTGEDGDLYFKVVR